MIDSTIMRGHAADGQRSPPSPVPNTLCRITGTPSCEVRAGDAIWPGMPASCSAPRFSPYTNREDHANRLVEFVGGFAVDAGLVCRGAIARGNRSHPPASHPNPLLTRPGRTRWPIQLTKAIFTPARFTVGTCVLGSTPCTSLKRLSRSSRASPRNSAWSRNKKSPPPPERILSRGRAIVLND